MWKENSVKEISVATSIGTLVAQVGGDDEYPEILVSLRNGQGHELMLCAVSDLSVSGDEDVLRVAVYGDARLEDYTDRFVFRREDVNATDALWL